MITTLGWTLIGDLVGHPAAGLVVGLAIAVWNAWDATAPRKRWGR